MAKKSLNIMPVKGAGTCPTCKPAAYQKAILNGNHDQVVKAISEVLAYFEGNHFTAYGPEDMVRLNDFVATVFSVITNPTLKISAHLGLNLVASNHLFCNIVATTGYKTTDAPLTHVLRQNDNLMKVLFLYNQRCELPLKTDVFFDVSPDVASLWYTAYILGTSNPSKVQLVNLQRHLQEMDPRWVPPHPQVSCMYFTSTYLAPGEDRRVKGLINAACKKRLTVEVKNTPDPRKIAIVSAKWHRNHAVYKSAGPLVNQLREKFDLTLVHLGEKLPGNLVTEGFEKIVNAKFVNHELRLPPELLDNNFAALYYPDIGMNDEGLWMSCSRIAPIQAMGYGHPATSGDNSEIDYFIGGDCEKDVSQCYSEQMVLIPGLAQVPVWPTYERKNNWVPKDKIQINCVWGPDKYNFHTLSMLAEISRRAKRPHEWHMFPSPGINRYAGFVPFRNSVLSILPNAVIHSDKEYYEYMEAAERGDFSVNSFPFGGFNTVVESLFLGLPIVTLEGDRYYNRAASYLLRDIGMPELSSREVEEFMSTCVKLIDDEVALPEYRKELAGLNLRKLLFNDDSKHFLEAFEYIFANHPIKSDKPILIGV